MRYVVVYGQTRRNFSAFVPLLPVVAVTGRTLTEIERHAREAIVFHLAGSDREDEPIEVELVGEYHGPVACLDGSLVNADEIAAPIASEPGAAVSERQAAPPATSGRGRRRGGG